MATTACRCWLLHAVSIAKLNRKSVADMSTSMFNSWGLVNAYGTYQSYYKQHLFPSANTASLNLIGAMQCFIVLTLSIIVGRILDSGHFYRLTIAGAVLVTLASFLLSLQAITSRYAYVLLTQGVLKALGMSCMFVPSSQSK